MTGDRRDLAPILTEDEIMTTPFASPRSRRLRAILAGAALLLSFQGMAQAQWYNQPLGEGDPFERPYPRRATPMFRGDSRPLPPAAVVARLESRGFVQVGPPRFDGSTYELEATSPRGRRVRFVIDAFRGDVLDRFAIGRGADDEMGESRADLRSPFPVRGNAPEEMPGARRFGDIGPETLETMPRRGDPRRGDPRGGDVAPPQPTAPRTAARPLDANPDGLNPDAARSRPAPIRLPAERAAKPDQVRKPDENQKFEGGRDAGRTDPGSTGTPPARDNNAKAPNAKASPKAPATDGQTPVASPRTTDAQAPMVPAPPGAVTAETARPDRPVRVIGGVTPMNADAAAAAQKQGVPPQAPK